jgi:predicted porin
MKKSLLALAVLTAISGAASAQSSVTLYGKVDLGLVYDAGAVNGGGKSVRISSGVTGGSRLGFKGVEDLGSGLKASFQLETGFCADSAAPPAGAPAGSSNYCTGGNFMGRQAYGALSGAFGSVSAGRQYSLGFTNLTTIDPFGTGFAGQINNIFDASGTRLNNSFQYNTPVMSGFNASVEFALGEQQGNWEAGRETGAAVTYANGPIYAGATYYSVNTRSTPAITADKVWQAGGTYDFGFLKLHAMVQGQKNDTDVTTLGLKYLDAINMMVGATVPLAGGQVLGSYVHHNDKSLPDQDANQIGVGYLYPLSKRTSVYTSFAHIQNTNGGLFTVGNASETGTGNKSFDLGVVHNF